MRNRQISQNQAVEQAKDRCVRANAERECNDCYSREARIAAKLAQAVAEVGNQFPEQARPQRFTALFLVPLIATKLDAGLALGLRARNALPPPVPVRLMTPRSRSQPPLTFVGVASPNTGP